MDLEAEHADVEVERLVLIEHEDGGQAGVREHAVEATQTSPAAMCRNCWSGPRLLEARRHRSGRHLLRCPIPGRRHADDPPERADERREVGPADRDTDVLQVQVGRAQQRHRPLDAAAGRGAHADHNGVFAWVDSTGIAPFASTGDNQFIVRAVGGIYLSGESTSTVNFPAAISSLPRPERI